ncbi:MAG: hypothetical protein V4510_07360 [bacterium]
MKLVGLAIVATMLLPIASLPAQGQVDLRGASSCAARSPPCGYINPLLDLNFSDKPKCTGQAGAVDLSTCIAMPEANATVTFRGTVRWYWKESEDTIYPPDAQKPVAITFATVPSNPSWMSFKVSPETYTIGVAELFNPTNSKVDQTVSPPIVYYWFERPVNVTFTRTGTPTPDEVADLAAHDYVVDVYVRAKSTESGSTYNAGFGGEYFRFDGTGFQAQPTTAQKASPAGWTAPVLALAAVAVMRRRRA